LKLELPKALEERIDELVRSGFYNSQQEFITEAVRLHLQNQKFKELERISEKWINNGIYRLPYWSGIHADTLEKFKSSF
jgi:Arc/MetJ-type ribon-helix-helix transcriptional regulator